MRPKPPKPGKRIFLEKTTFLWSRMSFISKITGRNLFRYKIRFYMTVLGIAGCMALMVAGFGLKSSVSMVVNKQFGDIYRYDMVFSLKDTLSLQDKNNMDASINSDGRIASDLFTCQQMLHVMAGAKKLEVSIFVPDDMHKLTEFVSLRHRSDRKSIGLTDAGVVITEKLADMLHVKVGDTISLLDDDRTDTIQNSRYHGKLRTSLRLYDAERIRSGVMAKSPGSIRFWPICPTRAMPLKRLWRATGSRTTR